MQFIDTAMATPPPLALTNLSTADDTTLTTILESNRRVIIDFWTTPCTRCPAALDKLNATAQSPEFADYKIISINCGNDQFHCDDARNIIEAPDSSPRWSSIDHYYAPLAEKEKAKAFFGFAQVPFYAAIVDGMVVAKGGTKFDFLALPGIAIARTSSPTSVVDALNDDVESPVVTNKKVIENLVEETVDTFAFTLDEDF